MHFLRMLIAASFALLLVAADEFDRLVRAEIATRGKVFKAAGARAESVVAKL